MREVIAQTDQTIFDLSVQELGSIEGVFALIDSNPELQLDLSIPANHSVRIPDMILNKQVVGYYSGKGIKPVSGLGEEVVINNDDMTIVRQTVNYNLVNGNHEFPAVRLLTDRFTVQIDYSGITSGMVSLYIDQSLDGSEWAHCPRSHFIIDPVRPTHTYNVIGLISAWARIHVELGEACTGKIDQIIWKLWPVL